MPRWNGKVDIVTSSRVEIRHSAPATTQALDVAAKAVMLVLLTLAVMFPDWGHMRDKAAGARGVAYPLLAFSIPLFWYAYWRDRASFPWLADLLVTMTCFTDTLGNRLDLYDSIVWFDDWIHFMNTGFLTAGVILLTMHHTSTLSATVERALAFGVTAAVGWEIAEYFAFISKSSERAGAYTDTLGDLALGSLGSLVAAFIVHALWRRGRMSSAAPQLEAAHRRAALGAQ
ncbi:MAG: hypothetical protein JWP31_772 [Aeromicrobium sp.]|nr:hypothetical protein [Aeromicrobium sp.]